jgi:pyruvate,water dikinase
MIYAQWLARLEGPGESQWGGEALKLARIARAGVSIAPGLAISASAQEAFFGQPVLSAALKDAFKGVGARTSDRLSHASTLARRAVVRTRFPAPLERELTSHFVELHEQLVKAKNASIRLMVRAGQGSRAPFLVREVASAKDFLRLLRQAYALSFEDTQVISRLGGGEQAIGLPAPLLVLALEEAEFSGEAACRDPKDGDAHTVWISARHHDLPTLPSLTLDDEYRVDRGTLLMLSREIRQQWWSHDGRGGHVSPAHLGKETETLTDKQAAQLARMVRTIQQEFEHQELRLGWAFAHKQFLVTAAEPYSETIPLEPISGPSFLLSGTPLSSGRAVGPVRRIRSAADHSKLKEGEVAVVAHLHAEDYRWLAGCKAVVCETGTVASAEGLLARSLGVPAVSASTALADLTDGRMITVDGNSGMVYAGKLPADTQPVHSLPTHPLTGTRVLTVIENPFVADLELLRESDGIGLLRGEFIIRMLGVHPQDVLRRNQSEEYAEILAEGLERVLRAAYPKPVVYQLHDLASAELIGNGHLHERQERNPLLGYRGSHRLLSEPELLDLELSALTRLAKKGLTNLEVMVPMARTLQELDRMLTYLRRSPLGAEYHIPLWAKCETPALLIQMEALVERELAGVCLDVLALSQLIVVIDRDNARVGHRLDQTDPAVRDSLAYAIAACRQGRLAVTVLSDGEDLRPETVQAAVEAGVTGIAVLPERLVEARALVASVERRMVLDYLVEEQAA